MITARTSLLFPRNGHDGEAYFDYFSLQLDVDYDNRNGGSHTTHQDGTFERGAREDAEYWYNKGER